MRVHLLNPEFIAMQSFTGDQVLILKQSLKDSILEKSPSDISSKVTRLQGVNDILRQKNESLLQENLSKNTIIQLLIKNQEYLNKSVCNGKTVLDETFKMVPKDPLKQENDTEKFRINNSNRFEVLSITDDDDDDDNDSKSGKLENTITEEFLTNDDVRNKKKYKEVVLLTENTKTTHYPRRMIHRQIIIDVKV